MRQAWIARPDWDASSLAESADARLKFMPLQRLKLLTPDPSVFHQIESAGHAWVVFTSPAAVRAFVAWSEHTGIQLLRDPKIRLAAIGSGTRDQLLREFRAQEQAQEQGRQHAGWRVAIGRVLLADDADRADAQGLLAAFDGLAEREQLDWASQTLLLAEAEGNRPTLSDGLRARRASVVVAQLYRRVDSAWPDAAWAELLAARPGEIGLVLSSSAMAERLLKEFAARGVAPAQVVWCTHHVAIRDRLIAHGVSAVRRVRLEPEFLIRDLFEDECTW